MTRCDWNISSHKTTKGAGVLDGLVIALASRDINTAAKRFMLALDASVARCSLLLHEKCHLHRWKVMPGLEHSGTYMTPNRLLHFCPVILLREKMCAELEQRKIDTTVKLYHQHCFVD